MVKINRVIVISLPRRADRRAALFANIAGWTLPTPDVLNAVDWMQCARPDPHQDFRVDLAMWGCIQSHLLALDSVIEAGTPATLILEDDAILCEDFNAKLESFLHAVPCDWDVLMLGGQHERTPHQVSLKVVRCTETKHTHAYVVRDQFAPVLRNCWRACEIDIDQEWKSLQGDYDWYAPSEFLIGQRAGTSDIGFPRHQNHFWNS